MSAVPKTILSAAPTAPALAHLGRMLKETERATGGDAQRTRFKKGTESPPTLADLGLDKKTSSLAHHLKVVR